MKPLASSFGNHFAPISDKPAKSRKGRKSRPATMEMESLENRILLSGISGGIGKKSVVFNDADGDLVKVNITGGKDATFDIDLGGADTDADIANIQINGNGSLSIVVSPVTGKGAATPGYTNVGSITVGSGVTKIGSIGLTAAVVDNIDLGAATANNISLNTGKVGVADLGIIDFHDITAGKVNQISLAGSLSGVNDFLGDITVTNGIGRITGSHSTIDGQILVEGVKATVGNIVVSGWGAGAGLSAAGDLTFNAAGFSGVLEVGGHLNLGISSNGTFTGTIHATGGISGIKASTTDAVFITGADIKGQILTDGDMGDLVFTNSDVDHGSFVATKIGAVTFGNKGGANVITASTFEADTIGVVTSYSGGLGTSNSFLADNLGGIVIRNADLDKSNIIDVSNALGNIDISNGNLEAMISAGSTGGISIKGGNFTGTVSADTTIGTIAVSSGQISGTIVAGGNITAISANWLDNAAADDGITASAVIHSDGNIGSIIGSSVNGNGINGSSITADGSITTLTGRSYDNGSGITGLVPVAASIGSITGSSSDGFGLLNSTFTANTGAIGSITGTGFTGGISGITANSSTDIGAILGKATASGTGILNSNFNAVGGQVTSVTGSTVSVSAADAGLDTVGVTASGNIGPVSGSSFAGSGISGGSYVSSLGNIGAITGTSSAITGVATSHGITGATFVASGGSIGNIAGTANGSGDGLNAITVNALTTVGTISATSLNGNAISGGTISGASVGAITATVKGLTGTGLGISGLSATATAGDIGDITVTSASLGDGMSGGTYRATGNIGAINVKSVGVGINGDTFTADSDFSNAGNITSISATVSGAGNDGIFGASFQAASIGAVTVKQTAATGAGDGIDSASFTALTKVETAAGSGRYNNTGTIGAITVTNASNDTAADGITGSSFDAGAAGSIGAMGVTTAGGDGILNSTFTASSLTGTDTVFTGSIGAITVVAADQGISNGGFIAEASIGAIKVSAGENGIIAGSNFIADNNSDNTGDIASVNVTVNESNFDGINGSSFQGANIGTVAVNLTATTGAGDGIEGASFTALTNAETAVGSGKFNNTGTIGAITVTNASTDTAADGIVGSSSFDAGAAGSISAVNVTTAGGDGIVNSSFGAYATTGTDNLFTGSIGNVTVNAADKGISNGDFSAAAGIGAVQVTSGEDGISAGSSFTADSYGNNSGNITSITVTTKEANFDGINGSTFSAANIGAINVSQTATTGAGDGIDTATFTTFTNTSDGAGAFNNLGTIGSITVSNASAGRGIGTSAFNAGAGGGIGAITVNTQTGSAITGSTFYAANTTGTDTKLDSTIGAIQILGNGTGIASGTFSSLASIGAISSTGTGSQTFTLNTGAVGTLTFNSLAIGNTVTPTVNTATSIGNVSVSASAGSGNFTLVGGSALTKLNNITVDGNVTLPNLASVTGVGNVQVDGKLTLGGLAAVTKFGTLTAGSLANPVGNIAIGNAAATSTSIGQIVLSADPNGNLANRYVFNFDSYTGSPYNATVNNLNYTAVGSPGTTTAAGGITLIHA